MNVWCNYTHSKHHEISAAMWNCQSPWVSPSVILLLFVLGGDSDRLVSMLGEVGKGAEGPQRTNRTGILFCLPCDSDEALPVPFKVTCNVALGYIFLTKLSESDSTAVSWSLNVRSLAWFSHPIIVQPVGRSPENTRISKLAIGALYFHRWKSVQLKWIRRMHKGLKEHRGTLSGMQHHPARQVWLCVSNGLGRHFPRRRYGPACG